MSMPVAKKEILLILVVVSLLSVPLVSAASTESSRNRFTVGICEYSRQLQDPSNRKQFLEEINRELFTTERALNDYQSNDNRTEESVLTFLKIADNRVADHSNINGIDPFSVKCLTCHDDVSAAMGEVAIRDNAGTGTQRFRKLASNHPIGMTYDRYASAGHGFKKAAVFNKNLMLFDGKVGCLTCHNPINPERRHLVMSDVKSALCLTCHDK